MKKLISTILAFAMLFSCTVSASGAMVSTEDVIQNMVDEKMAVITPQLEAQDALYLIPTYEEIVRAMVTASIQEESGIMPLEDDNVNDVYAPRGGCVSYKLPREWGVQPSPVVAVGCTKAQAAYWTNNINAQITTAQMIEDVFDILDPFEVLPDYVTSIASQFIDITIYANQKIINDIQSCNGKVLVVNTYSYIDNAAHPVVMGWGSTSIPVPYNATNIVAEVN